MPITPPRAGPTISTTPSSLEQDRDLAGIGLLSIPPTVAYIRWKRAGAAPTDSQIAGFVAFYAELVLFAPLLAFAAAMARGELEPIGQHAMDLGDHRSALADSGGNPLG